MIYSNKSLCIFIHFFNKPYFPKYVEIYVKELSKYFDELILITNQREIQSKEKILFSNVKLKFVKNEGYDLGMFYKAIQTISLKEYHQIACVNDSNILFKSLESVLYWGKRERFDFWGIIDSYEKPKFSTHADSYHIQSHFLVLNKKAIEFLPEIFESIDIENLLKVEDVNSLRNEVINKWEIGLSQFYLQKGLKTGSYIDCKKFSEQNQIKINTNLSLSHYDVLITEGYPLLKKRVIFSKKNLKWFFRPYKKWDLILLMFGDRSWDINGLIKDLNRMKKEL